MFDPKFPNKLALRQATVLCVEDTEFMIISREMYVQVIQKVDQRKKELQQKFFRSIPFLNKLPYTVISKLHLSLQLVKPLRG